MTSLPRILIVDDQYGGVRGEGRNRPRENFCLVAGIRDVTGDVSVEDQEDPIAEAVFCRGQAVEGGRVHNDLDGTLAAIRDGWRKWPRWALLFLDLHFRTGNLGDNGEPQGGAQDDAPEHYFGLALLEKIWQSPELHDLPIVVLSSKERDEVEHRFASSERSVAEFIDKSTLDRQRLAQVLWDHGLLAEEKIIGHSIPLLKCLRDARRRARLGNDNILLLGETGTGKELLARYIHEHSPRNDQPYVTVYTQGVPETLVEDRIFGHERGAFTGATAATPGAAEDASGGTLFIDEFGDVPASVQSKLLRLLDKDIRETQRLGAREARQVDLQVVLATNRLQILSSGDFRQDLLYRAKADEPIVLPRLQDRREDIPLLVEHFVRKHEANCRESIGADHRTVAPDAMDLLRSYGWPGNVRQLDRVIESAVYKWPKLRTLSAAHLSLSDDVKRSVPVDQAAPIEVEGSRTGPVAPRAWLETLGEVDFNPTMPSDWSGISPELLQAFARIFGRLLRAALLATRKPTPANPGGEIKIHPAMKLVTGDAKLTASKAADVIKRMLSLDKGTKEELLTDTVLAEAHEVALRLRPKASKHKARPKNGDT